MRLIAGCIFAIALGLGVADTAHAVNVVGENQYEPPAPPAPIPFGGATADGAFGSVLRTGQEGSAGGGGGGGGAVISAVPIVCRFYEAPAPDHVDMPGAQITDLSTLTEGDIIWSRCHAVGGAGGEFVLTTWGGAAPVITAAQLAEIAIAQLVVPLPQPRMAPPPDHQLTGLRTWLHLDNWNEQTATAAAGGLSVTVHARPTRARWSFPDASVTCDSAGAIWERGRSDDEADCSIVPITASFTRPGQQDQASVTVTWDRSWTSSDGQSEQLAPLARTSVVPLVIREYQVTTS